MPPCNRANSVCYVKQNLRFITAVSKRNNRLALLDSEHEATNTSTTMNYDNVAYDSLTFNMASATLTTESNSK